MVNREQDVMDRVHNDRILAGNVVPLHDVFTIEPFDDEHMLSHTETVFDIGAVGHAVHSVGGSLMTPLHDTESFDLFKLQDEEPMDALDPTKEPSADWEPGPEDVAEVEV